MSTSLPTIASDLNANATQYTWVGVAYLLTQTAFQPLYGRISDIVGRKVRVSPDYQFTAGVPNLTLAHRIFFILALQSSLLDLYFVEYLA